MALLDVAYINPFIAATRGLLSTMVKIDAVLGKPRLCDNRTDLDRYFEIAVQITLSGSTEGVVALLLSKPVALEMAGALAGTPFTAIDADCCDALGEVANMLVGQAKVLLPGAGAKISIPKVMASGDVKFPPGLPVLLVPFDTPRGRFIIAVSCSSKVVAAVTPEPTPTPEPAAKAA